MYSLYSYFIFPYFFTDKYKYSTRTPTRYTSFLIDTPSPSILFLSNYTIPSITKNISEHEIKRFVEKIKKYPFKPVVMDTFEEI
jgi:hypothetical protein